MKQGDKNYITPAGHAKLLARYEYLSKEDRPSVVATVTWAASLGDRSENADYQYSKRRLREIDRELAFIFKRLEKAEVIDPSKSKSEVVQFGATVIITDDNDQDLTYQIVGVDEIDLEKKRVSWRSPMAMAMLGKKVGESFLVKTPRGDVEYEVKKIVYQRIEL